MLAPWKQAGYITATFTTHAQSVAKRSRSHRDLRSLELAGGVPAATEHGLELTPLGLAQFDPVAYVHPCLPGGRHGLSDEAPDVAPWGQRHGQAGSVPGLHRRLHARPWPCTRRSRPAAPLRPDAAQRASDGAHVGAPRAHPPPAWGARSIEVLLDPDCLPRLRPPQTVKTSAPRN